MTICIIIGSKTRVEYDPHLHLSFPATNILNAGCFSKIVIYFGLWPLSIFPLCTPDLCFVRQMAGRTSTAPAEMAGFRKITSF